MSTPVAIGVGAAAGALLVVLLQAALLWLYCKHAEHASTKTTTPYRAAARIPNGPGPSL